MLLLMSENRNLKVDWILDRHMGLVILFSSILNVL